MNEEVKADYLYQTMGLLSEVEGVSGPIFWYILSEPKAMVNGYGLLSKDPNDPSLQATYLPAYGAYKELWETKYVQVLPAIEDTYVSRNNPNSDYGTSTVLKIGKGADFTVALARFDLSTLAGGTILQRQLRFLTANTDEAGSLGIQRVKFDADGSWSEESIREQEQSAPVAGTISNTLKGTGYQVQLDSAILQPAVGATLSLMIDTESADELVIHSREWNSSLRLIVYYAPPSSDYYLPFVGR